MNLKTFERRANEATEDIFTFSGFIADSEFLSTDPLYTAAWLEAEIVNACALDKWDMQGRPGEWKREWQLNFKGDAIEVLTQLKTAGEAHLK